MPAFNRRRTTVASAVLCAASMVGMAQQVPLPVDLANAHLSPTLYFASTEAEQASRQALHASLGALARQVASAPAGSLLRALDRAEAAEIALQRHAAFLKVRTLENTADLQARAARDAVNADEDVLGAAVAARLRAVPAAQIAALGRYAYQAEQLQRDAAHRLPAGAEQYRALVTLATERRLGDRYDALIEHLPTAKDTTSPDLITRRAALAQREAAYDRAAPEAAALLAALVDSENADAAAQGYANAADRKYASLHLSGQAVTATLAAVQAEAAAYQAYQQLLAAHAARRLGVAPVLSTEVELVYTAAPPMSLDQARAMLLAGLQPLGADYVERFAALLDPANGRLDLAGGSKRARTGTSIAVYDAPVALFFEGYMGSLRDVSTIAHEGGHAIHRELMNAGGIPVYEREGPHSMSEGFAIFNELLLLDQAVRSAPTPAERTNALERMLAKFSVELFVTAEETAFERSLYTEAAGHATLDPAAIDTLYRRSIAPFETWPVSDAGSSRNWMRKSLLFEDPLYLVNYLYATVIAASLFEQRESDPQFADKYEALLRRGFDADPQTLLSTMGIHLDDPALIRKAAALFAAKTGELATLYAAQDAQPVP